MFRLKLARAVLLAAIVFVTVQLYFIFTSKIGEIGPLSQADKNLVFQGHDNKQQPLQPQPTPGQDPKGQFNENTSQSNTGNVAVGFGENAPQNVPTRVGMPQVNNSSSIFVGSAPQAANSTRNAPGAPQESDSSASSTANNSSSGNLHLKSALGTNSKNKKDELSSEDSAQLTMQMAQAHLKNQPTSAQMEEIRPGHSDKYMQMLQRSNKQRVNNDYERCLIAIMLLEKAGNELALSPAQARYVLKLIEEAENSKYAESQAQEKITQLLSKEQKLYINKSISRKPLYANGPAEDDPTEASLRKAIEALEKTAH